MAVSCTSLQQNSDTASAGGNVAESVHCNRCTDFRRLVIVQRSGRRCEVHYVKFDVAEKMAGGSNRAARESVFDR